ncbi:bifunctional 4-hydroxy-3-methylbut-2-enyl diphosphate reductase/30S ribosomal protein S1 [Lachnospiraceae bacterium ZAX-1]
MNVICAKSAGFCFGVKRAVDKVYEQLGEKKQDETLHFVNTGADSGDLANAAMPNNILLYTYGPIIHNEEVVEDLAKKGVKIIETKDGLLQCKGKTIVIRSHGVSKDIYDFLEGSKIDYVDATCPFVRKIHRFVKDYTKEGYHMIVIGNHTHPEVVGIKGWGQEGNITVISCQEEAQNFILNAPQKLCIVAQTTFNNKKFQELVEIIEKKGYDINVLNTICNATQERQAEAMEIAAKVDAMIVIGGKHSSNTQKLFELCKKECENTYYIQTLKDLDVSILQSIGSVGITAGASTPNNIIEEVQKMSEMSFEQMLDASFKTIRNGEVVDGTVIDVKPDEIILNIGYKSDGIITRNEYTNESNVDLTTLVAVGDTMEAKVLKVNDGEGQVLLTYKRLAAEKGSKRLEEAFNNQEVLTARVAQVLDGGLSVVVDESRIFIPASLVSDSYEKDLTKYNGQEIEFVISEFNPRRRRIIGNRKQLLVAKKAVLQKELFERINVGDVINGTIKNVTDFGAFIDLGGADGLLHISEMSWGRVENPKKVFKVGEEIRVFIKDIKENKIALSLKFEDENPWKDASIKFAVGTVVTGVVARMTDFGAFVELAPGVDALLHVSQISRDHVEKPSDVLKAGQQIEAQIVDFNEADRKISLSMKVLLDTEEEPEYAEENRE